MSHVCDSAGLDDLNVVTKDKTELKETDLGTKFISVDKSKEGSVGGPEDVRNWFITEGASAKSLKVFSSNFLISFEEFDVVAGYTTLSLFLVGKV